MNKDLLINSLLTYFIAENREVEPMDIPSDYMEKRKLLRVLMNIRGPEPIETNILKLQDNFLSEETKEKNIVDPYKLPTIADEFLETQMKPFDKLVLWQGDITTISTDAIVNAANSKMLGCFVPLHKCIDNAIHSAAGIVKT